METTLSSPTELAAWCGQQIEYLSGLLDTFDFSRGRENRFGGYFAPLRKPIETKADEACYMRADVQAKKRCRDIYRDLTRVVPLLFPAEFGALPELDHPFRQCHKLLAALALVQQWCGEVDDPEADREPGSGWWSVKDLAKRHDVPPEPLRKRLGRWRRQNGEGWMEVAASERKSNEPRFLYRHDAVRAVIHALQKHR